MNIRIIQYGCFALGLMISCSCSYNSSKTEDGRQIAGEYFGETPPGDSAILFAKGIMSTGLNELNAAFFPGGKEVIFSVALVPMQPWEWRLIMTKEVEGKWTEPEVAAFNKDYSGVDPFVSYDGNRIYFCSNRPLSGMGVPEDNFDIWYTDRTDTGWSEPVNLGAPINTKEHEFYPSFTREGTIYFQSRREGGFGLSDIYCSRLLDGEYSEIAHLPKPINSEGFEGDALIAPDESYLILSAEREDSYGRADLYVTFRESNRNWTELINLGPKINSSGGENCQILSPCGRYLFFTSRRSAENSGSGSITYKGLQEVWNLPQNSYFFGDIYWVDARVIEEIGNNLDY